MSLLWQAMQECLTQTLHQCQLCLPPHAGQIYSLLHRHQCIRAENITEFGDWLLEVVVDEIQWQKWLKHYPQLAEYEKLAEFA
jgi:GTP-binding protein HflX